MVFSLNGRQSRKFPLHAQIPCDLLLVVLFYPGLSVLSLDLYFLSSPLVIFLGKVWQGWSLCYKYKHNVWNITKITGETWFRYFVQYISQGGLQMRHGNLILFYPFAFSVNFKLFGVVVADNIKSPHQITERNKLVSSVASTSSKLMDWWQFISN